MTSQLDEYRHTAYERVTQRITRGLLKMRSDLHLYRRKPTKRELSRLCGIHVNTLDVRSRISISSANASAEHSPAAEAPGWPLSELRSIQDEWKKQMRSSPAREVPTDDSGSNRRPTRPTLDIEAYKKQNIELIYRNEELALEVQTTHRINANIKRELERVSGENARLKAAQLAQKRMRAKLKVVR